MTLSSQRFPMTTGGARTMPLHTGPDKLVQHRDGGAGRRYSCVDTTGQSMAPVCTLSAAASGGGGQRVGKVAFLFPGQGSAAIGMGEALAAESPAARHVLDQLGTLAPDVRKLMREGP